MRHSLDKFKPMREELCKLVNKKEFKALKDEFKEIKIFLELYKLKGPDCPFMLGICEIISITPELKKRIDEIK